MINFIIIINYVQSGALHGSFGGEGDATGTRPVRALGLDAHTPHGVLKPIFEPTSKHTFIFVCLTALFIYADIWM